VPDRSCDDAVDILGRGGAVSRDDEQVWAELVEAFHSSPDSESRQWPDAENVDPDAADRPEQADQTDEPAAGATDDPEPPTPQAPESAHTDEHFVPPTPPPLPSTDLITRAAWASVLGVPVFLTLVVLLGRSLNGWLTALCAGAFIGGFAILVARLRGHDPYDPDDGAVV
jgi:hypothetical protein